VWLEFRRVLFRSWSAHGRTTPTSTSSVTIPSNSGHKFWSIVGGTGFGAAKLSQSLPIQVINSDGRNGRTHRAAEMVSQSLPIQVINSDQSSLKDGIIAQVESQSLPIQVINSDTKPPPGLQSGRSKVTIPSNSGHKFWSNIAFSRIAGVHPSQSLPIQVINSDSLHYPSSSPLPLSVTIPSNSGHKFWSNSSIFTRSGSSTMSQSLPIQVINSDARMNREL